MSAGTVLANFFSQQQAQQFERMEKQREQQQKLLDNDKHALGIIKTNPELLKESGMTEEGLRLLSPGERVPLVSGLIAGAVQRQQAAETERKQQVTAAQLRALEGEERNAQRFPQFASELARYGTPMAQQPGVGVLNLDTLRQYEQPLNLQTMMQSAARTGYRPDLRTLDDLLRSAQTEAVAGPAQVDTIELPFGSKGVALRGSKDLKVLTPPVTDLDIIEREGRQFIMTKSGPRELKAPADASGELTPARANGAVVPGVFVDSTGRVHDFRDTLQKMGVGKAASPASPEAQKIKNPDPKRFKTGQRVRQNGVEYIIE